MWFYLNTLQTPLFYILEVLWKKVSLSSIRSNVEYYNWEILPHTIQTLAPPTGQTLISKITNLFECMKRIQLFMIGTLRQNRTWVCADPIKKKWFGFPLWNFWEESRQTVRADPCVRPAFGLCQKHYVLNWYSESAYCCMALWRRVLWDQSHQNHEKTVKDIDM
jgi:hypothetical protein